MRVLSGLAIAMCAAGLVAGCASRNGPKQTVGLGISAEEKDAVTRADSQCDRAGTSAVTDPSNHCFIHRRATN